MARKKSLNDIIAQRDRIISKIYTQAENARFFNPKRFNQLVKRGQKVEAIADRYRSNIGRSEAFNKAVNDARKAESKEKSRVMGDVAFNNRIRKAYNQKYSQSTYMGLSNG